jgi:hypothetical protein
MSDKKEDFYITINTTASLKVQLDADIYSSDVLTEVGLTKTKPANTVKLIPSNARYALASGLVQLIKKKATTGTEPNQKTRSIKIMCETSKVDTAVEGLNGKTVKLGNGATPPTWTLS